MTKRMQRRGVIDLVVSLMMASAFTVLWLIAHLSGWFVVVGLLLVAQAAGYAAFAYWIEDHPPGGRLMRLAIIVSALWYLAAALVTAQISIAFGIGLVMLGLGLGVWGYLLYLRRRRRPAG